MPAGGREMLASLAERRLEIVDLTQPLSEATPVIQLPPELKQIPGLRMHPGADHDHGPDAWSWFEVGEHVGTHFDAPCHWVTGRHLDDVASVPIERLIGPLVVIDRRAECEADPDYLLRVEDIQGFEADHGPLPDGGWLVLRSGWGSRAGDRERFLNITEGRPATPGFDAECARWIASESPLVGIGVETVGIDAGRAFELEPSFPAHHHMLGAGKYGVTQLANVDKLPPTGATIIVAPMKLVGGTGAPARVVALVPGDSR